MPFPPSRAEVKEACRELGLSSDWSAADKPQVEREDAERILAAIHPSIEIDPDSFRDGLAVELEHGREYSEANVTNNHPVATGKIVLAHMLEMLDYYERLDVAENEGELMKAAADGDWAAVKRIADARLADR